MPKPLYTPNPNRPMQVVVFGSGSGTTLEALLRRQQALRPANAPPLFAIKALFTDRVCRFQEIAKREGIPLIFHSLSQFFQKAGIEDRKDPEARAAFDEMSVQLIEQCAAEKQFEIDLIFLAGYMSLIHSPLLKKYQDKIVNVHPADLTVRNGDGKRSYIGTRGVYKALIEGETRTRSSVILINDGIDAGPILASGPWVPYKGGFPVTLKRAAYQQERQKALSDWPASAKTLELIAQGRLRIGANCQVYLDDAPLPEGGYIMEQYEVMEFIECVESSAL